MRPHCNQSIRVMNSPGQRGFTSELMGFTPLDGTSQKSKTTDARD